MPSGGAVYPTDTFNFGYSIKSTAALIKADVGVEAIHIDVSGWDTHANQGVTSGGQMFRLMDALGKGVGAFHTDLFSTGYRDVTLVVVSEFGRVVRENGSRGTDHGHGNCILVMGGSINGGRVLTQWPGLAQNQLYQGQDLNVTIDYRDILAEIVARRLNNEANLAAVFPGYTATFRGVTR